jgi:hypothetical protein
LLQISVGEHHGGILATQFEGEFFKVAGGAGLHDTFAGLGGTGERHLVDIPVVAQRSAGGFAVAGDHVDHARGEAGQFGQFAEAQGAERGLLGGLDDHCAAGGQGRRHAPYRQFERVVPGHDNGGDADGLAQAVGEHFPRSGGRQGFAGDLGGVAGHVAQHQR